MKGTAPILTPMHMLPEEARTARPRADAMLLCPLTLQDRPSGDAPTGLIAVFGERHVLSDLTGTLEILAHQVALTLESVLLRQEAIRQRNEAYFRALVQDASDAIVIVDDHGTVKYATPSTAAIFGEVAAVGKRFWDLVAQRRPRRPRPHLHAAAGTGAVRPAGRGGADHPARRQDRAHPGQVQ